MMSEYTSGVRSQWKYARIYLFLYCLYVSVRNIHGWSPERPKQTTKRSYRLDRRIFLLHGLWAAPASAEMLSNQFQTDILLQPPVTSSNELKGVDNTYFPEWMQGSWAVSQTLVNVSLPLGFKFAGGPNGDPSIAQASLQESQQRLNQPVLLQVRYKATPWGVAEDRVFNTMQRLNAFAGRTVVASVQYADVGGSNRASIMSLGGKEETPLQTTVVQFKGPAAQKTFVTGHGSEFESPKHWVGYESQRAIFVLTNQNTAPPIWTDTETLWDLELVSPDRVRGNLRIAGFLTAQDKLYFDAKKRAVSIQDYTLDMTRIE